MKHIFRNLIQAVDAFSQKQNLDIHRKRDQYMYDNFLIMHDRLPKGNFFGQWGLNHVYQSPQLNVNWLAYLLDTQENSPVKGKVLSMAGTPGERTISHISQLKDAVDYFHNEK